MHPKYTVCNRCMTSNNSNENIKKIYTISGRTTEEVFDSIIKRLRDDYQVNKEVMSYSERIELLENTIDLIGIKEHI